MSDSGELSPLKQALLAVREMRSRVAAAEQAQRSPIAIVGVGCRFPGGVVDLGSFWALLDGGVDAVGRVPSDRWDAEAWYGGEAPIPGRIRTREGGFLDEIARFDAAHFGIAPREALEMDPAQRMLLEVSWEALEHAGIPADGLDGTATGVFVGLGLSDYARRHFGSADPERLTPYSGTGSFLSVAAGRISYALGLNGPAMTVDTACSSSLVAVHLAVQSLRRGETDVALAGGANTVIAPEPSVYFSQLQALAPDGRCKSFDARADGYGRGEGCGVLVLKRLDDAERDGDRVLGVIRGTAVNQDGRSNGLTAPSGRAQRQVIRQALDNGGVAPGSVGYVEAHGTGTPLGDPIEIAALADVFRERAEGSRLTVGSVKTNFGHTETAAGVAGILKALLVLHARRAPPHLHLKSLNPRLDLGDVLAIPAAGGPVDGDVAGVSSFGLSGTNAHILLERVDSRDAAAGPADGLVVLPLSAASPDGLVALAGAWLPLLADGHVPGLARGAALQRAHLAVRRGFVGTREALIQQLTALTAGGLDATRGRPEVVFAFTGQGAQRPAMGRELYEEEPVFRAAVDDVIARLQPHLDGDLATAWWSDGDAIHETQVTQPALFALHVGLVRLLESWGLRPDAVVGHSIGEFAAAWVAGVFDLDEACRLVAVRAGAMGALPTGGAMAALFAAEAKVVGWLVDGAEIAAVNGPTETVISGEVGAVEVVIAAAESAGVSTRRLTVSHAFHSARMDPAVAAMRSAVDGVRVREPALHFETTGGTDPGVAEYWAGQLRHPVRFADAVGRFGPRTVFVELGPRPVLTGMGARIDGRHRWVPTLIDGEGAVEVRRTVGRLFELGVEPDWQALLPEAPRVELPRRPWVGDRYWLPEVTEAGDGLSALVLELQWTADEGGATVEGSVQVAGGDFAERVGRALGDRRAAESDRPLWWIPEWSGEDSETVSRVLTEAHTALMAARGPVGLVTLDGSTDSVVGAALAGLARVASIELGDRWLGWIDRDGAATPAELATGLVRGGARERRLRAGRWEEARLRPARRALGSEGVEAGTWLLTGGFGALGRQLAEELVRSGVRDLVLVGRSGGSRPSEAAWIADLAERGVTARGVAADVSDRGAVGALVAGIEGLVGVVHGAGLLDDGRLSDLDAARISAVLGVKLGGAMHLAQATDPSVRLVFLSSASATLGTAGQGAYAAANAGITGLARRLRGEGREATSLEFGPWSGEGMGQVASEVAAAWARSGVRTLYPADGVAVFRRALGGNAAAVVVAPFDWLVVARGRPAGDRLLADYRTEPDARVVVAGTGLVDRLRGLRSDDARRVLGDHVRAATAAVLGRSDAAGVDPDQGFFEAGLDSLMAVELRDRLQTDLGASLPATLVFDRPTVTVLTDWLADELLGLGLDDAGTAVLGAASDEPIAILGAGCRFPGAEGVEAFWDLLEGAVDAVGPVPDGRFDVGPWFDPVPGTPGRLYASEAGYVRGLESFDAELFGISPREARVLDPQQRMLLETAWSALEDAAIAPDRLAGTATGVFVGIAASEYGRRFDPRATGESDPYSGTGNESSFAPGRVAHALGLRGPSLAVNTACSSSLVALHLAAAALRQGECTVALAGGVNAIVAPDVTIQLSQIRALSPRSRCSTFDASADGYVRGEGCGLVVLKRLSDAVRDGDPIRAVILGSAVGHDGAAAGLTVPSGPAQESVIREALARAGVAPREVGLIECHGTGTPLGDPIEVGALRAVFRERETPLLLGSVKTNIGHLEAGAGVAGLLKAALSVERGRVPASLHLETLNPELPLGEFAVEIPCESVDWAGKRTAGLSSFGLSGTNAHVVLGQGPAPEIAASADGPWLLALSGHHPDALRGRVTQLRDWAAANPDGAVESVLATLARGRAAQRFRTTAVVGQGLVAVLDGLPPEGSQAGRPRVGFVFTGQGSQYAGMGSALYERFAVFRDAVDEVAAVADPLLERPLLDVLFGEDDALLGETQYTQPALFALQVGLARLWSSLGVEPVAVAGHSIGQLAAAVVAGVWSIEAGTRLAVARGRAMGELPLDGRMIAVRGEASVIEAALQGLADVDLAAVNTPMERVYSGPVSAIGAAEQALTAAGLEVRPLKTSHAFHSALMEPAIGPFVEAVSREDSCEPRLTVVQTGLEDGDLRDPAVWGRHIREAVHFESALRTLGDRVDLLVEIGPHPVLLGMAAQVLEVARVPSIRRGQGEVEQFLAGAGALWERGASVEVASLAPQAPRIHLPTLPFVRTRYWVDLETRAPVVPVRRVTWSAVQPSARALGRSRVVGGGPNGETLASALGAEWAAEAEELAGVDHVIDARPLEARSGPEAARTLLGQSISLLASMPVGVQISVLTAGAVGAGVSVDPAQRALWGLAAAADLEHGAGLQLVDLDSRDASAAAAALQTDATRVAVRGGALLGPALVDVEAADEAPVDGIWWVTGGLGALGLAAAGHVLAKGAAEVVLTGRSEAGPEALAAIAALEELGAVHVWLGDVSAAGTVHELATRIESELGPVAGVVHAAGALSDGLIRTVDEASVDRAWSAKALGAWHLHKRLPASELVFFSSIAGVVGSVGQGAYGAANAWLDGLAEARRESGGRAVSVAWGPWQTGFADRVSRDWRAEGITPLASEGALEALDRARSGASASVLAVDIDWATWGATLPRVPGWLASVVGPLAKRADPLAGLAGHARVGWLQDRIVELAASVSGRTVGDIRPDEGFFDGGFDSLMAVELVERLQRVLGRPLPRTLVFEQGSPSAMARHLAEGSEPAPAVAESARHTSEAIAVIGMACRFPGADSPEAFWELLEAGRDLVGPIPADRWDAALFADEDGRPVPNAGAFVESVDAFDADFFGISAREAASLDPQQRLLLEVSWVALERAGQTADLVGSRTGVFAGVAESDYLNRFRQPGDAFYADLHAGSGNESSFPAGRVSHLFGLQGPAVTLNTACSSSLVATHLASNSLRLGESDLALAAGVSLMLSPDNHRYLARIGALSPTGRCHTFDARADGYVRGEGCGVLVLKRLSEAERDGDPILAVIRGSAINHDGPSSGLTVPNGTAQQRVIREALGAAGLRGAAIDYLEAHGTGTPLGDPIELRAASAVLGEDRDSDLVVGSVKTNVGHLEQAAAMAGIFKVILALGHDRIPRHLGLETVNPEIALDGLEIAREGRSWPRGERVRRAGVSSFGISGTNGHLILEEPPVASRRAKAVRRLPVPLWGHTAQALRENAERLRAWLPSHAESSTADLAASAWLDRRHDRVRAVLPSGVGLTTSLEGVGDGTLSSERRWVFLFTGQGAQTVGMGQELYSREPVFRAVVDRCAAVVDPVLGASLVDAIFGRIEGLDHTRFTQPAMYAYELAMTALWAHWGVRPSAVLGHSVGQFGAAAAAGVMSLEVGAELVAWRGQLMGDLPGGGRMVAVPLDEEAVGDWLAEGVELAAVNGPAEVVLSGDADEVGRVVERLTAAGIAARPLTTSHAFHSHRMDPVVEAFRESVRAHGLTVPSIPLIGNADGAVVGPEVTTADFWADAIRQPVRFAAGVRTAAELGYTHFLEVGNHPVLSGLVLQSHETAVCVVSGHRKRAEAETVDEAAAEVWLQGGPLDVPAWVGAPSPRVSLPTTAFARTRHWLDAPEFAGVSARPSDAYESCWVGVSSGELPSEVVVLGADPAALVSLREAGLTVVEGEAGSIPKAGFVLDMRWVVKGPESVVEVVEGVRALLVDCEDCTVRVVATGPLAPALAALAGVANEERGEQAVAVIETAGGSLVAALGVDASHSWIRAGSEGLEVRELVSVELPSLAFEADASRAWLITGGFGDLGLQTASWLVERGVRELWLVGRSGAGEGSAEAVSALEAAGARVHGVACDVSDLAAVQALVSRIEDGSGLGGVVHAAGVIDDDRLENHGAKRVAAVLGPKAVGAWNLVMATQGLELRALVLYSSAASILGLPGQGIYAAANGFLDGLAATRSDVRSIQWGPWAASGMVRRLDPAVLTHQERLGIGHLAPKRALALLERALAGDRGVVAALSVDWVRNLAQYGGRTAPGLLARMQSLPSERATETPQLLKLAQTVPREQWVHAIEEVLTARVRRVLRDPGKVLDREQPLWDLGMDSMMTIELRNELVGDGVRLKVARMIGGPSIAEIAHMVVSELEAHAESAVPTVQGAAPEDGEEPPLDPRVTHLGAAFGGALVTGIVAFVFWQLFLQS